MVRSGSPRRFAAFLVLALLAPMSHAAEQKGVRLVCPVGVVTASDDATWHVAIKVINDLDIGIFGDSLTCEIDDLDPGITGAGRHVQGTSNVVTQVMRSLGQRDSTTVTFSGYASCDRARLTFHLFTHSANGTFHESTCQAEGGPSLVSRAFPSAFLNDKGRRIEIMYIAERWPREPSPALLLVHPEGSHARRLIPMAWGLANAGYSVMMVSLPGYGQSTGPADFAGPASVRALSLALDSLRRTPQIDVSRIAVWGISRGASAAALLAAQRKDLKALVLQSGVYDPATAYRTTKSDSMRHALDHQAKSNGGWNARSALRVAGKIKTPVLFIHGDLDSEAVPNQSLDLAGKLRATGGEVEIKVLPGVGHAIPSSVSYPLATGFLKPILNPAR